MMRLGASRSVFLGDCLFFFGPFEVIVSGFLVIAKQNRPSNPWPHFLMCLAASGFYSEPKSEKVFVSQERVSGFPEKGLTSGEVPELPGKSGELPGKFGKLPGNLRIAVKFHSERTSGEVAKNFRGSSGNLRGSPGTSQKLGGARLPTSDSPNLSPTKMCHRLFEDNKIHGGCQGEGLHG